MVKAYRTRSTKGAGGTRRYTTQSSSGSVSTSMSYKTGTGQRTAVTRKSDGSVVQTKTHRRADGYTTRERKTIISKPKTNKIKFPKPKAPPKMKLSVVKVAKIPKLKPYRAPKTSKSKPFKWPTSKRRTSSTRPRVSSNSSSNGSGKFFFWLVVFALLYMVFVGVTGITPN